MPMYRYTCECGESTSILFDMGHQPARVPCEKCGGEASRDYTAANVIPDDLGRELHMAAVKSADNPRKYPIVRTRSELQRELRRSNERYGTKLEQA